ncbi:MAG: TonB family protein [Candidatus Omnitrophica bacterium]|nr:TonB family protein [Candidatus Omnitrophota bacterium]
MILIFRPHKLLPGIFIALFLCVSAQAEDFFDPFFIDEDSQRPIPPVTKSFSNADVRDVLHEISSQTGVKIIPDESVQGKISIDLKKVDLEGALRLVLSAGNFSFRLMPEGYYLVGSCTPASPSFNQLSVTESFRPNYLKVKELYSLLSVYYEPYIHINEDVNTVTVTASPEVVKRVKEDLAKFDKAPRQVMIEALVIEIAEDAKNTLGVAWGPMQPEGLNLSPGIVRTKTAGPGQSKATTITGALSADVISRINAMVAKGKAKIKANPRVATLEGRQAEISVGTEEYATVESGPATNRYSTLQPISSGVVLKITPFLDEKQQITVRIAPEVSEVVGRQSASGLPVITKRTALTTLRVDNGQTIAIGGLIQEQKNESTSKWPVLGGIPLVGPAFFQHKVSNVESKEVIILITPHILQDDVFDRLSKVSVSLDGDKKPVDMLPPHDPEQRYYYDIGKLIDSNKQFPDFIKEPRKGETKEVVVEFTVFSDGTIAAAEVVRSSGNSFLDENAVESIEGLSPLPPFPAELKKTNITFTSTIRFES